MSLFYLLIIHAVFYTYILSISKLAYVTIISKSPMTLRKLLVVVVMCLHLLKRGAVCLL